MEELKLLENELVPVYITSTGEKVVYGTELHAALEVKTKYADWVSRRFYECEGIENEDYETCFSNLGSENHGGQNKKEHIIKLDTAKEMAMLERNEIGKLVRKYFIQVEKKYKEKQTKEMPEGKELLALAVIEAQKMIEEQTKIIERMKPKEIFADAVATSRTSILVGELAKLLKQNGYKTGQNRLFEQLRQEGYLVKKKGTDYNMPTQRSMELGLFEIKETTISNADGSIRVTKTPKITGKGQQYFINKFLNRMS